MFILLLVNVWMLHNTFFKGLYKLMYIHICMYEHSITHQEKQNPTLITCVQLIITPKHLPVSKTVKLFWNHKHTLLMDIYECGGWTCWDEFLYLIYECSCGRNSLLKDEQLTEVPCHTFFFFGVTDMNEECYSVHFFGLWKLNLQKLPL